MVSSTSLRLSSVVPATMTGDENKVHELTNMDLAMKLHYIKGVYFFKSEAVEGLTIYDLKKPMFELLQLHITASGRIRITKTGRPFIKCNDGGVRIVEAHSEETVDEWFARAVEDSSLFDGLAYNQSLGPDLGYSPLVFLQFTWFKCGGMAVGLSWANVLGDAFSASDFMNMWGKIMAGHVPRKLLHVPPPGKHEFPSLSSVPKTPFSLKRVDPVGDYWVTPNNYKMRKHIFHVSAEKLDHLVSNISCPPSNQSAKVSSAFEVLSAIIWKTLSKIKESSEQIRRVTICTKNAHKGEFEIRTNDMVWSTVEANFLVAEAEVSDLVELMMNKRAEENGAIEEMTGREEGGINSDFIAYGAKLTFMNLEEAEIYRLELKGQKPVYANYGVSGVGDEGLVLVLPASTNNVGRLVSVVLPENQLAQLKSELQRNWSIA
ncbi:hypothetical protein ACFX19_020039 [Malus domestica]